MDYSGLSKEWSPVNRAAFRDAFLLQLKPNLIVSICIWAIMMPSALYSFDYLFVEWTLISFGVALFLILAWFAVFNSIGDAQRVLGTRVPRGSVWWIIKYGVPRLGSIVFVLVSVLLLWNVWVQPETPEQKNDLVRTIIASIGGLALLAQLRFASKNTEIANQTLELSRQSQNAETFYKAIEQLNSDSQHARIGALFTLEEIARDNERLYFGVMNTVSAFVMTRAGYNVRENDSRLLPSIRTQADLSVAISLLANRVRPQANVDARLLRFSGLNLHGVHIRGGSLKSADFSDSQITNAQFENCDLQDADFGESSLYETSFHGCDLAHASFRRSNLIRSDVRDFAQADLVDIAVHGQRRLSDSLVRTDFTEANLEDATVEVIDLSRTKGLTQSQIDGLSELGAHAKLPIGLKRKGQ